MKKITFSKAMVEDLIDSLKTTYDVVDKPFEYSATYRYNLLAEIENIITHLEHKSGENNV